MSMIEFPLSRAFQFIEPGPVILVTTWYKGKANVMTLSWHMVVDFTPLIGLLMSPANYSYNGLWARRECVIAIPTVDLIGKVVDIGNCSGQEVDKFEKFKLTTVPAKKVRPPLIAECLANIECRVIDTRLTNKYGLFIMEGVKAWYDSGRRERRTFHAVGNGTFRVDGRKINLRRKMVKWQDLI